VLFEVKEDGEEINQLALKMGYSEKTRADTYMVPRTKNIRQIGPAK